MKNAAIISRWLGRTTSTVAERIVAPNAYGRSVCVVSASTNVTKITVGSLNAPNDRNRLEPSCAYGLPLSTAASDTTKLARREDQPDPEEVGHVPERQPERRQRRDQQRHRRVRREAHIRRGAEHRPRRLGQHRLLLQQLEDVVVRLQDPRPAALLNDRLSPRDDPSDQRRQHQDGQHLQNLNCPVGKGRHFDDLLLSRHE